MAQSNVPQILKNDLYNTPITFLKTELSKFRSLRKVTDCEKADVAVTVKYPSIDFADCKEFKHLKSKEHGTFT